VIRKVCKRDGRFSKFDQEKIANAIYKAARATGGENRRLAYQLSNKVVDALIKKFSDDLIPTVEEIQDTVEKVLIENGHAQTAKTYILYRKQHEDIRNIRALFLDVEQTVDKYITREDWRINENSNMSYSLQGLNNHIATTITAQYWLNRIYPKEIRDAHVSGDFHIHDLGLLSVYCCGWDLKDLLLKGFKGVEGKVASKPAKHLRPALGQIVNFFYTLQGESAGAQAFSNFDTLLAPFIAHDKMTFPEVKQALQEFIFNINVPTRVGFQTPFTNLTMDLTIPSTLADEAVVIGGEITGHTYGEYQDEMDVLNRAFAEVMMEGDAKGRVFTFPIPTYNLYKEFDWSRPVIKPILEMTAKYGIPYFANFVNSDMKPEDARSMCCRLRLDNRELRKRGGGLFGANPLTGSIGVVTLNMPRIGFTSKNEEDYFSRIGDLMDLAKESLEIKRKALEQLTEKGLYPYAKFYLSDIYTRFGQYWKNHFNTIGLNGMNESLLNFTGKNMGDPESHAFTLKVMAFMRERLKAYQEETGNLYNLEASPAEGAAYRLARVDRKKFPGIIAAGEEEPYYTNSTQLPVGFTDDLFEALSLQDAIQSQYTGGTVFHGFIGEAIEDTETCKHLIRTIAERYHLPYFTITPTFSVCPIHGYLAGRHDECPKCREEKKRKLLTQLQQKKRELEEAELWEKQQPSIACAG